MKRCLAIRWGAFGDMLYCLPTLEKLKQDYDYLHLETGGRGEILFRGNPLFDRITVFDLGKYKVEEHMRVAELRWNTLEQVGWDKAVNFWRCLEVSCIAEEHQEEFFYPRERRREIFGPRNFYDMHLEKAGYPHGSTKDCGTFYFDEEEVDWMNFFRDRYKGKFIVAFALCGSTGQKVPFGFKELAQDILDMYPETMFVLLGDKEGAQRAFTFGKKNVMRQAGVWSYRQSLAMTKMADYVIGPETSLLVGAGMFGTPKTMICTSCSVEQATKYQKNDFSIQSTIDCSPCHRAIYNYFGKASERYCNKEETELGNIPACNLYYDKTKILEGVRFAYQLRGVRKTVEKLDGRGVGSLPDLRSLYVSSPDRDEEVRRGLLEEVCPVRGNGSGEKHQLGEMEPSTEISPRPTEDFRLGDW